MIINILFFRDISMPFHWRKDAGDDEDWTILWWAHTKGWFLYGYNKHGSVDP